MKSIRILIADDHAIVRMGLVALLESDPELAVVGEADDGCAAVRLVRALKPDVVIMDLMMPAKNGIEATRELRTTNPETKILVLTTSTVSDELAHVLEAGAAGAVTKSTANKTLLKAIHAVAHGDRWISPEISELIAKDPPAPKLTPRQLDILSSVARGLTNADIACQYNIREDSVKGHLCIIFEKIGAANRSEAVAIALKKHLLKI